LAGSSGSSGTGVLATLRERTFSKYTDDLLFSVLLELLGLDSEAEVDLECELDCDRAYELDLEDEDWIEMLAASRLHDDSSVEIHPVISLPPLIEERSSEIVSTTLEDDSP
jgi:hypothetical protein